MVEVEPAKKSDPTAGRELSDCLFSQYALTVTAVLTGTGYAMYRKPKNGMAIMLAAGGVGTLADLAYAWGRACRPQVVAWNLHQQELLRQKERDDKRDH